MREGLWKAEEWNLEKAGPRDKRPVVIRFWDLGKGPGGGGGPEARGGRGAKEVGL